MVNELVCECKMKSINYIENNNITEGINTLIEGLKINNKDTDLLNILGLLFYKQCKFNEAMETFKKSIYLDSNIKAKEYLDEMCRDEFKEVLKIYNEGIEMVNKLELDEALDCFKYINKKKRDLIEPYIIITEIYLYKENYTEALKWLEELIKIDIGNEKIVRYRELIEEKNITENDFVKTELNHKEIAEVRFLLAMSYEEVSNFEMAVEEYKNYIEESEKKVYEECALASLIRIFGKLEKIEEKNKYEHVLKEKYGTIDNREIN
ncbi:MAG: tetratricopeptide repeat protein [Clostridium sp.]